MHTAGVDYTLDSCLDPEAMRPLLQQALPGAAGRGVVVDRLRVLSARRNASRHRNPHPLTLRYEAEVHDDATGAADTLQLYGKVYRGGASAQARQDAPALHLPQLDMLLWRWPADPGLPQLAHLLDPEQTRRWWGQPARAVSALRYEPEQRATLCYSRDAANANDRQLYVKTFSDARGEALLRRFTHFHEQSARDRGSPAVARPLGYCAQTRAFWQAPASGIPLQQALAGRDGAALPGRLAQALVAVHAAPHALAGVQAHDTAHWLMEVRRRGKKVSRAAPHLGSRVVRLADAIEQSAALLPRSPLTVIHGDFHAGQAWLDGERVVLFDFDEFAMGDPMEDVAAFLARLRTLTADPLFAARFLAAYEQIAPAQYCRYRLQWHRVVQQMLQVSRAFVFQVPDWRAELERRLTVAEALCAADAMRQLQ